MKFFSFFGLTPGFYTDQKALRQAFLRQSRRFHPDFHTQNPETLAEAEENTAICNEAYTVLSDFYRTVDYVLRESGYLEPSGQKMDSEFLMEMMELNEAIMECKMDPDSEQVDSLEQRIDALVQENENELKQLAKQWNGSTQHTEILEPMHHLWLRRKYLLRLKESLTNIAAS